MFNRAILLLVAGFLMLSPVACGSKRGMQFAAVSGKVLVDGEPASDIIVVYEPVSDDATRNAKKESPASSAITDQSGRYTLKVGSGQIDGALVGQHRVRLMKKPLDTADAEIAADYNVRAEWKKQRQFKQLPKRYNDQTEIKVDVPASGSNSADFEIESK